MNWDDAELIDTEMGGPEMGSGAATSDAPAPDTRDYWKAEAERLRAALESIRERWESEDNAANQQKGFDSRRSRLAWAMWTDAKAALGHEELP